MTSILVTGASGRIGSAVCDALPSSIELWKTSRSLPRGVRDADQWAQVDLADPEATDAMLERVQPDVVVHLAGSTGSDQRSLFESNVLATTNLLQAVDQQTHVVVAGSAAEYGPATRSHVQEDDPLAPVSAYGWSKAAQTRLARSVGERRHVRVTVARPFNVVSSGMPMNSAIGNVADQIARHSGLGALTLTVGRLDVIRDFVPLSFVASAFVAISLADAGAAVYNICSGQGFELREIVDAMAEQRNVEIVVELDPELAAIPAVDGIVGDPSRLTSLMGHGWNPSVETLASIALAPADSLLSRDSGRS